MLNEVIYFDDEYFNESVVSIIRIQNQHEFKIIEKKVIFTVDVNENAFDIIEFKILGIYPLSLASGSFDFPSLSKYPSI